MVLILDDEPSLHRVLGGMMHLHGLASLHATNLQQLKSFAEQHQVHAFVLDLNLDGGQSGVDALAWLRQQTQYSHVPVVVLTGLLDITQDQQRAFQRHAAHVFHKGHSLQPLMALLKRAITAAE